MTFLEDTAESQSERQDTVDNFSWDMVIDENGQLNLDGILQDSQGIQEQLAAQAEGGVLPTVQCDLEVAPRSMAEL